MKKRVPQSAISNQQSEHSLPSAYCRLPTTAGFTLIELIVSIGLFSFVLVMSATAYLSLLNADSASRASADVVGNLSFALDSMARSIKTGSHYACDGSSDGNCAPEGNQCFSFVDAKGTALFYLFDSNNGTIKSGEGRSCDPEAASPITDPSVHVDMLRFYGIGVDPIPWGDFLQARVIITVAGYMNVRRGSTVTPVRFSLQTQATQRALDI